MYNLAKSILYTITWFDIFDYPLTLDEIYWWLYNSFQKEEFKKCPESEASVSGHFLGSSFSNTGDSPHTLREEIKKILKNELSNTLQEKDGYYFLTHRQETIPSRQQRYKYSKQKMKRVKVLGQFLKYFPFIKMVAICNVLGYMNSHQQDDIDFFIITHKSRIWSARFWLTGILKILNLRPKLKSGKISDKFCLSFWITEDNMDLEKVALNFNEAQDVKRSPTPKLGSRAPFDDIYFHYWLAGLKPIYDADNYFQQFLQSNQWVKKYLPNLDQYYQNQITRLPDYQTVKKTLFKTIFEKINFPFLEKFYRWFQLKWMPKKLKELSKDQVGVIIRDNLLKFHLVDKRAEFRQRFLDRLKILDQKTSLASSTRSEACFYPWLS